jgi:hypothetical protein
MSASPRIVLHNSVGLDCWAFMSSSRPGVYALPSIGQEPDIRDDGSHVNVNETIDASVFVRWRADPSYRPANLVEWARRKKVDPAQLETSVRADDPRLSAPSQ